MNNETVENTPVKKSKTNYFLVGLLLLLFVVTLFITLRYIDDYYSISVKGDEQIITVHTEGSTATIINSGSIDGEKTKEMVDKDDHYVIEKISSLTLEPQKTNDNATIKYNVRYNISANDYELNATPTNNSEILVKFSYSLDKENWTDVNNVVTTTNSNISPLIGNTYDIAGLVTDLSVATNYEISAKNSKHIIYWRSETIFKNKEDIKKFKANFGIEYGQNS